MWLIVLLLLSQSAHAATLFMSSFDVVDDVDSTTLTDVLDMATTLAGGATDADIKAAQCANNSYRCRLDTNSGASSSRFAGALDLASGESAYWSRPTLLTMSTTQGTLAAAFHVASGGGAAGSREIMRWEMGSTKGCNARLNSDETITLYWQDTSQGTTESVLTVNACSDNPLRGCTTGADCVSGTCSTCSASTGAGCFWPTVELVQINNPSATGDRVSCQLWVNGAAEVLADGISVASGVLSNLTNWKVGGVGTESQTMTLTVDDVVVTDDIRAGTSYLHWMTAAAGVLSGAIENACGSGSLVEKCVGDWGQSALNYRNFGTGTDDTIRTATATRGFYVTRFCHIASSTCQPLISLPAKATIPAVATPFIGRTGTGANWTTRTAVALCSSGSAACESLSAPFDLAHGESTTPILTGFPIVGQQPGGGGPWTVTALETLGAQWIAQVVSGGNTARAAASGAVVQIKRDDSIVVKNLNDHNIGTEDGSVTVMFFGDSTACGTGVATCPAGADAGSICNQQTHCSWDDVNKSKPVGGCTSDSQCRSCTNRATEFNGGAGYLPGGAACTSDAQCDLGTCTSGTCTGDADVTCAVNDDCKLGACRSTATCADSCRDDGATVISCPVRSGWPAYVATSADQQVNCCQDATTTAFSNTWTTEALYGRCTPGDLVSGPTGRCECSTNAECGTTATCTKTGGLGRCRDHLDVACTVDGDCPGVLLGELCLGECTASDIGRATCTGWKVKGSSPVTYQCASSARRCVFGRMDYEVNGYGLNDLSAYHNPTCALPYTSGEFCDQCTETQCTNHASCSGVYATSRCLGERTTATTTGCLRSRPGAVCTTNTDVCASNTECVGLGGTCTGYTGGAEKDGLCTCTGGPGQGTCDTGFVCGADNLCRKSCTVNGDCGTGGTCTSNVCHGQCTCPCEVTACSTDADCPLYTISSFVKPSFPVRGTCTAGRCAQCGPSNCAGSPATHAWRESYWQPQAEWQGRVMRTVKGIIDAAATAAADATPPLLIPVAYPRVVSAERVCHQGGWNPAFTLNRRTARQYATEYTHSIDPQPFMDNYAWTDLYVDYVHPGALGAQVWGGAVQTYMQTLNSCRTGTGQASVIAKYCQNLDGTWHSPDTTCTTNANCTGSDICVQRKCTTNDDASTGCPGTPTCNLE